MRISTKKNITLRSTGRCAIKPRSLGRVRKIFSLRTRKPLIPQHGATAFANRRFANPTDGLREKPRSPVNSNVSRQEFRSESIVATEWTTTWSLSPWLKSLFKLIQKFRAEPLCSWVRVSPLRHYSIIWKRETLSPRFAKISHPYRRNFVSLHLSKPAKLLHPMRILLDESLPRRLSRALAVLPLAVVVLVAYDKRLPTRLPLVPERLICLAKLSPNTLVRVGG